MPRHGWLVAFLLACVLGCRQASPQLTPVSGKVSYQGIPLRSGMVVFTPNAARGHSGDLAMGTIEYDGSYALRTGDAAGVAPGWYRVTVAALNAPSVSLGNRSYSMPRSAVPEKYRDPALSKLECEVTVGQANVINFDLE